MISIFKKINDRNEAVLKKKGITEDQGFPYLKEKLFLVSIEALLVIGTLAYIPSLILAVVENQILIVVMDSIVMGSFIFFALFGKIPSIVKMKVICVLLYVLGVILLYINGPQGTGLIYLMGFSLVSSTFLNFRSSIISLTVNLLTIIVFGIALRLQLYDSPFFTGYSLQRWIIVGFNFMAINIIMGVAVAYFVLLLKRSLSAEQELKIKLRKKSERLIEAKIRAEESDQLKSSFLANVSHEFRTPMNSIMGFTEIMIHTDPEKEKRMRYLNNIHKSSEQLLQIIHNTIEYSKIELGTIELNLSTFQLDEVFDTLYEQLLHNKTNAVGYRYVGSDELLSSKIYSDKEKLFQVFTNLILNAFKFTNEGEVVFGVEESAHDNFYQFFVKDTGIGIRKEKQKDIFTRFHKEDDFKAGTGLGLSISATLIMHMGGRIWLESEPGKGTIFYFIIPVVFKKRILD
ncbi:MAG: HAMP domain-containing histidine kinase [Bacteroidales bacterium]|nr:HAMP domain-containing histidine kinase [Bacteroidales bacterium]MBN2821539.1 HAMP domain-containing histidine kinase [Bacteroidales bacterium]